MDDITIKKLEEAFALGCSDLEACYFANISRQTLYNYQNKNPEFVDRKEALKERPVLLARACVVKALEAGKLEGNPALAKVGLDYLSKKKRDEFAERKENTGPDGGPQEFKLTNFPKEPQTIAEWEAQVQEANAKRDMDTPAGSAD